MSGYDSHARDYQMMRAMDPSDPVIFHEVTGRAANTARVTSVDLLRAGSALVPPALREKHPGHSLVRRGWPVPPTGREKWLEWDHTGLTGGIDFMAGDDKYVFFDLGWTRANPSTGHAAFGFRLSDVVAWCGARVGFRPHDLGGTYGEADRHYLDGLSKVDPEKHKRLMGNVRELAADPALRSVLMKLAACGTAFDAAMPLARAHLLSAFRGEDTWDQIAHMVPRCGREENRAVPDLPFHPRSALPPAWALHWGLGRLGWRRAFQPRTRKLSGVEIVVGCPLPVRLAHYYLGPRGWDISPYHRSVVLP